MTSAVELEHRLMSAMRPPPEDVLLYDGWHVGLSRGDAKRARSVNAIDGSSVPVEGKIAWCEERYAERGMRPVFRLTAFSPPELDGALEQRGYVRFEPSLIMARPATATQPAVRARLNIETMEEASWLEVSARLHGWSEAYVDIHRRRLAANPLRRHVMLALERREPVGCGMVMLDDGYAGLFDIFTVESQRGRGVATAVCAALMRQATALGAQTHWLSVLADNEAALTVYRRLGFEVSHEYWYRVRPEDATR